jgi:NitT/TauT family transport system permease protein
MWETFWPPILLLVGISGAWEVAYATELLHQVLFPPPSQVLAALINLLQLSEFASAYAVTVTEIGTGFAIGLGVGLLLGVSFTLLPAFRGALYPFMVVFQALPKIVLAPLFVVWFGFGPSSKVAMAATICFFPVMINTMLGLSLVDEDRLRLMRSLRASNWQVFTKLRLPAATPAIFAGVKTSLTLAIFGTIAAEFTGASEGIGTLVSTYNGLIRVDYVIALVLTLSVFGLVVYLAMEFLDRKLTFWTKESSG